MTADPASQTPFAAYVERITKATGWTPTELARRAKVAPSTLTRPRSDARHRFKPSLTTLHKLAMAAPGVPIPPGLAYGSTESGIAANASGDASGPRTPASSRSGGEGRGEITAPWHLRVSADGRIEVPADVVARLDPRPGEALVTRVVDGLLTIETVDNALRRVRASVRRYVPEGVSLVDGLIAERRAEAARE